MKIFPLDLKTRFLKYLGLPKSLFLNIRYFGLKDGWKLPILLSGKVILKNCKGKCIITKPMKRGMILIGFTSTPLSTMKESSVWNVEGEVIFQGHATLGRGSKIAVGKNAKLVIGNSFEITANSSISCHNEIEIGDGCLFSWDILCLDTDGHDYFYAPKESHVQNPPGKIKIGKNCWIGCRCTILKNSSITEGSIVGAGSLVNKKFDKPHILIAGVPAKIIKEQIFRNNYKIASSNSRPDWAVTRHKT